MNNSESNQTSKVGDLSQSLDVANLKMEQLRQLFPETFTEGKIDIKRLTATLGENVATGRENYELSWAGKADARAEIQKRTTATLRPDTANSVNWDATQNLYIEGENLEVLRTLQKAYFGKVKMIYIDPPYNTGNDSFVYPDDYNETLKEYQARTGQTDEAGFVNNQTLWKKNSKENGQFHSVWLSMMYPRLFLARNLLRDDGVIFVSIDDNEAADLKLLMDEIFGEENFIDSLIWKKRYGGGAKEKHLVTLHEYVFFYAKNVEKIDPIFIKTSEESIERYYKLKDHNFELRGAFRTHPLEATKSMGDRPNLIFSIATPDGGKVMPQRQWLWGKDRVEEALKKDELHFIQDKNGKWSVHTKQYLKDEAGAVRQSKAFSIIEDVFTQHGTNEIIRAFGNAQIFPFAKPTKFIEKLLSIGMDKSDESIILDFFSGSGSTAETVMELNEEDGGNRQFICVQMPEALEEDSEAFKAGYRTIADIGRARIQKVIERMEAKRKAAHAASKQKEIEEEESAPLQALGFNAFKLGPSNFKEWRTDVNEVSDLLAQLDYHIDSTKPDSEAGSMVYELLLKLALPVTTPIESHKVGDAATAATVYMAKPDSGKRVAMFFETPANHAGDVLAFILKAKPVKVLCLNKCFVDSQALTNFSLQLQDADIALEVL